jgi:hypothetical protein
MVDWEAVLSREHRTTGLALQGFLSDDNLTEDLGMIQPDGSRACVDFELRGRGYSLVDPNVDPYSVF